MTKSQKGILNQNVILLELIYKLQSDENIAIFSDEITEALLIAICAQRALIRSIERQELQLQETILPTSQN
jgi:hypothetical protein